MSSHVVVLDSTARRATIKTTPGKYLTDILQEACKKLGVNASQYGLKHKSKQLDLSLAFRLSGLSPGAKLELVQLSRSPSVVTLALQLPASEARGAPNGRLTDKFPSTTSIWMVLRKFEAGVAGSTTIRNLTGRGVPVTDGQGSGRLFYETPVVQVLDREVSTLADFQKSLAQLGFNSGNVLLRLSFRRTDQPLEEAMVKVHDYFKSSEDETPTTEGTSTSNSETEKTNEASQQIIQPPVPAPDAGTDATVTADQQTTAAPSAPASNPPLERPTVLADSSRPVTIYAPPSNDTPQSAQTAYNDADFTPSIEHAQIHQRRLQAASKNTRLLSDAEIAAAASAAEERRASVKEVEVKIRLPDQSQIISKFRQQDTGKTLYGFVRSCLASQYVREKFILTNFSGPSASKNHQANVPFQIVLPDSDQSYLIKDHRMAGRVLVNFSWDATASPATQQRRSGILKSELQTQAQELKVQEPPDVMDTSADLSTTAKAGDSSRQDGEKSGPRKIPKWLKLPGKK
ncbi:GLUT4 regulating protein TUG-domain-containing protein [Aspergillus cavernicola]|uniref:GLUT4 regulating protein TUG-domain-containing protein n=1 Tax=Aspergillus cavernicola TaxID=176166 RepID=A0ABR4J2Y7_9EURO